MHLQNKTIQKIISFLIIITIFFSVPAQARAEGEVQSLNTAEATAGGVCYLYIKIKGYFSGGTKNVPTAENSEYLQCQKPVAQWLKALFEAVLKQLARRAIEKITSSTINWINSGFHGQPLFLKNPESFFKDIVKSEVKKYVDLFGYDLRRFPFGKDFALNTINAYKSTAESDAAYSLNRVMSAQEAESFRNDFNVGGWNAVFINTQYQQNNEIGFQMRADDYLAAQLRGTIQAPAEKINSLLAQGQGFLSPQTCSSNPAYNNGRNEWDQPSFDEAGYRSSHAFNPPPATIIDPSCTANNSTCERVNPEYTAYVNSWNTAYNNARGEWAKTNACVKADGTSGLVNTTPGSVAANQIMTSMSSGVRQSELGAAMGNSLSAIFDALLNHFLNKGLSSLSNTINPPPTDNWSYDGNTLNGNNPSPGALIVPQNVSTSPGQETSTTISGGTAPYLIGVGGYNPSVATARISGATLTIHGVAPGETTVTIKDSSSPEKMASVRVTVVGLGNLMIIPANVETTSDNTVTNLNISGGTGPYNILSKPDETIATAQIESNVLLVFSINSGETSLVIKDSSPNPKTATVRIMITAPTIPLGTCTTPDGHITTNISKIDCTGLGGTWVENQTGTPAVVLTANPTDIGRGDSSVLSWNSSNTTSCSPSWLFAGAATSGSSTVSPNFTRTYNITCINNTGQSATNSVTVNVN